MTNKIILALESSPNTHLSTATTVIGNMDFLQPYRQLPTLVTMYQI